MQPADVFAAVGRSLPSTFDDEQLQILADEILARSASRVLDPTGYVIRALRDRDLVSRGSWLIRAEDIAREHAFDCTPTGQRRF
ncbi:hypothetical protein [Microbacterium sp. NIBRBAC000506063]|uniref:hypothetical protein n=1 Tax=Microbacterium sp. NIBRBAC000506063 TaxID=2734618 RepID=UPI001BB4B2FC|nr:hypothetical protein [Microbacterium sp. NIBRBAC000506063]QTV79455.1 hypothetical protein KAE78_11165 [Microbacterium sp. NIBRBAC000506063]